MLHSCMDIKSCTLNKIDYFLYQSFKDLVKVLSIQKDGDLLL